MSGTSPQLQMHTGACAVHTPDIADSHVGLAKPWVNFRTMFNLLRTIRSPTFCTSPRM